MTTLSVTPFSETQFILATLERQKTEFEILEILQPECNKFELNGLEIRIALKDSATLAGVAQLVELLEPHCLNVVVSATTSQAL